jgi:tRNA modification GTPase
VWLGRLGDDARGGSDEVVLTVKRTTPTPWLEIHCHGGREVIRLLEEVLAAHGAHACSWQELERQTAGDDGRPAALAALTEAPTTRTAVILLDQYHGALHRAVAAALAALEQNDVAQVSRLLGDLARFTHVGRHLTVPWRVVIAGAPNVGKSSLVNALAGYQRSVVAPTPGTTRDVVTTRIAVAGWPVELADTAGWREAATSLERQGIDLARTVVAQADLFLWVLDASAEPVWPPASGTPVHLVVNKTDLGAAWDLSQASEGVRVSARTGTGLDDLVEALGQWLVPDPPPAGAAVPFTDTLCSRVKQVHELWHDGQGHAVRGILESLWEERR